MTDTLHTYHQQYEKLMHADLSEDERDKKLAALMTRLEQTYSIPMLQNKAWEQKNRNVIALYRKISQSRHL